jgi:hypothetical protein
MARLTGFTPDSPYRALVGPGVAIVNPNEALLSPAGPWDAAAQDAFLNSGAILGATDDGWSFSFAPEYAEWGFAGVPGNIRGGRRMRSAAVSVSGALTEITEGNVQRYMPGATTSVWQTAQTTPARIGTKIEHEGVLLDTAHINALCIVGERQGQKIGGIFIIRNALNVDEFTLGLSGDEDRSAVDMTFNGTYGVSNFNATTGAWKVPVTIYLSDPAVAV